MQENPVFAVFCNFLGKNSLSNFGVKLSSFEEQKVSKKREKLVNFTDGLKKGKVVHKKSLKPA